MRVTEWQKEIDSWIKRYGVKYFKPLTNMAILMEEVGELARILARLHGEQSFKEPINSEEITHRISDEMADVLFVLACLANQHGINLESAIKKNLEKKTNRDATRHLENKKLKS